MHLGQAVSKCFHKQILQTHADYYNNDRNEILISDDVVHEHFHKQLYDL
jgi:hypothetical protein